MNINEQVSNVMPDSDLENKFQVKGDSTKKEMTVDYIQQKVLDLQNPRCLTDALFRHQTREKLPNGNPKIDETDIRMMIQESIGAGLSYF